MLETKCLKCEYGYDDDGAIYCSLGNDETCMTTPPIVRVGGKHRLARKIIALFPEHTTYVEPFGGAAHVLLRKMPSKVEVYNDFDGDIVNFFRVAANPAKCAELAERLAMTLYAREEYEDARGNIDATSDVDRAYNFAVLNRQSFGGKMTSWGYDVTAGKQAASFAGMPEGVLRLHNRLKRVKIERKPFEDVLCRYDRPGTLFYLDPPYPFTGGRGKGKVYRFEMTDNDHRRMVDILLNIQGKAILSGYDTPLYEPLESAGWKKICLGESAISLKKTVGEKRISKTEYI